MHARTSAIALLACAGLARATDYNVPTQMPLSVALATAVSGDTIIIHPSGSPYSQFPGFSVANKRLTIRGSTGNPADVILDGSDLDRVLSISGSAADGTLIEGITIQNGRGPATADASGAGLYITGARVTIQNCIIRDNLVPAIDGNGAGLYASASTLTVRNTRFEANRTGVDGDGGGVYLNTSDGLTTVFEDCIFHGNIAEATLTNEGSGGGGIWVDNGTFRFTRCTFTANQGEVGGGAYVTTAAVATFDACRVDGNNARFGAGLYISSAATSAVVRNSLIVNNHSLISDSAIRADKPTNIVNCTITGNDSDGSYTIGSAAADRRVVIVDNTIIWNNLGAGGISPITGTNAPILRRCLVPVSYTVANGSGFNTVADPAFVNAAAGNYRIQATSPAVDAGDTGLYFGPLADYDILARGVDIPAIANSGASTFGPVIDIGAYEVQVATVPSCYANCDGSTATPLLTANDFQCFINAYAGGCS